MTSYHISIGYIGIGDWNVLTAWGQLKRSAREIANNSSLIVKEARRLGAPETCDKKECDCSLKMYADYYKKDFATYGHPVAIISKDEGEEENEIMQIATTGPAIKYCVRRAYVRLLIEAMHKKGIEVNLIVA